MALNKLTLGLLLVALVLVANAPGHVEAGSCKCFPLFKGLLMAIYCKPESGSVFDCNPECARGSAESVPDCLKECSAGAGISCEAQATAVARSICG